MQVADGQEWFTRRYGRVRGPFPQQQITRCILLGRIRDKDELSTDGENWVPLSALPELIPDVMKNVVTDADRQRLHLARLEADERRGGDRRTERMSRTEERRSQSDRRRARESGSLQPPVRRQDTLRDPASSCVPACSRALAVVVALLLGFVLFTPDAPGPGADCEAASAPGVIWNNCRSPGLVAEQADLHGAQLRNMDLTGAQLTGANLAGSDLAYSGLQRADLRRADLRGAGMIGADLRGADLRGARLNGADLSYADLRDARLEGAELGAVRFGNSIWQNGRTCAPESVDACR